MVTGEVVMRSGAKMARNGSRVTFDLPLKSKECRKESSERVGEWRVEFCSAVEEERKVVR